MMNTPYNLENMDECLADFIDGSYIGFWDGAHMQILNRLEKDIIAKQLPMSASWFLELGCGQGRLLPEYIKRARNIVLVDYAAIGFEQIEAAYSSYDNIYYIAADVKQLPFRSSVFDTGLGIRMVNNYPVLGDTINEISRVFQNNATVVMSYFNRRNLLRILKYGLKCFERTHKYDFKGSSGLMCATHPDYFEEIAKKHHLFIKSNLGSGFSYQITHNAQWLQKLIETNSFVKRFMTDLGRVVDYFLGKTQLALWQFVQLKKQDNTIHRPPEVKAVQLLDVLCCPICKKGDIIELTSQTKCAHCQATFLKKGKIYDFRKPVE